MGRVLVVDDGASVLAVLEVMLELEGFEVTTADSGVAGLQSALEDPPDVIVLDVMMPELDGPTLARTLANQPTTSEIPIVFLTALAPPADVVEEWGVEPAGYLRKPFENEDVIDCITRVVDQQATTMR